MLPALSGDPLPDPVFFLAGGPGQAATELTGALGGPFRRVNRDRDLVFVDQRGTGQSNPLTCELDDDALLLDPMSEELLRDRAMAQVEQCLEQLDADPRHYTTPIAMDDLDEVRAALGYDEINLWGGSYGTRAGLVYLRRHPDRVRTAILDGLAPVEMKLPLHTGRDEARALDLLLDDCAADPGCGAAYMIPGMATTVASLPSKPWMAAVPSLGQQMLLTQVLGGEDPGFGLFLLAGGSSLALGLLCVAATARLFRHERIVFGRAN